MKKRDFIKNIGMAALAAPISLSSFELWIKEYDEVDVHKLATSEDFWLKIRSDYKLKPDYINLESGYYNIIPQVTLNKLIANVQMVNFEGSYYMRTKQWKNKQRMTEKLAKVVGCAPKNLIITRNTTESLDMVIKGFSWKKDDEAVFAIQDYGAMRDMFGQVSDRYGVRLNIVSIPNHPTSDEEIISLYENAITSKTKLLMICHMINITGQILPVKKICQMAHARGVQVMVDGAHCVGHFDFNIADLECDYYGSSLHKWLAVPLGTGLLYVKNDHVDTLWPLLAESKRKAGDISRLNHTGTHPVYHDLTIEAAVDYYNMLGAKRKETRLRYLQEYWTSRIRGFKNVIINTPMDSTRACAIANVGITGISPNDLANQLLHDYKIFTVAINHANVQGCRITPNVFTTIEELDSLTKAIKTIASS